MSTAEELREEFWNEDKKMGDILGVNMMKSNKY